MIDTAEPFPCPFCSAIEKRDKIPTMGNCSNLEFKRKKHGLFIECLECGARGPIAWSDYPRRYELAKALRHRDQEDIRKFGAEEWEIHKAEALRLWNQRASVGTTANDGIDQDGRGGNQG